MSSKIVWSLQHYMWPIYLLNKILLSEQSSLSIFAQKYLCKYKDTYFILENTYFHIYKDSFCAPNKSIKFFLAKLKTSYGSTEPALSLESLKINAFMTCWQWNLFSIDAFLEKFLWSFHPKLNCFLSYNGHLSIVCKISVEFCTNFPFNESD